MLTRRGWGVIAVCAGMFFVGRLLGILELYVLAAAAGALVLAALLDIGVRRVRLDARRELHPAKVHAGSDSRVELELRNRTSQRSPVVTVRDPFDRGRRQARFLLAPLAADEVARAAYRLPTERRGVFDIGPLEIRRTDAFGLASSTVRIAAPTQLTVFPHVDPILPLPQTHGHDPLAGADHPTALGLSGEDFYALRQYEVGDDLRRVHWPSTARVDELMIRQHEMPWQGRATVLLDVRARAHNHDSIELAVSAAASIIAACWRRGSLVRLVSTDGTDSGFAAGAAHIEAMMERLAVVRPTRDDRLTPLLGRLRRAGNGGALAAVVTEEATATDLEQLARAQGRFAALTLVVFERSSYGEQAASRPTGARLPGTSSIVRVTADEPFAPAWNRAMGGPAVGALRTGASVGWG